MEWPSSEMRRRPGWRAATARISSASRSPHTSTPSKVCGCGCSWGANAHAAAVAGPAQSAARPLVRGRQRQQHACGGGSGMLAKHPAGQAAAGPTFWRSLQCDTKSTVVSPSRCCSSSSLMACWDQQLRSSIKQASPGVLGDVGLRRSTPSQSVNACSRAARRAHRPVVPRAKQAVHHHHQMLCLRLGLRCIRSGCRSVSAGAGGGCAAAGLAPGGQPGGCQILQPRLHCGPRRSGRRAGPQAARSGCCATVQAAQGAAAGLGADHAMCGWWYSGRCVAGALLCPGRNM